MNQRPAAALLKGCLAGGSRQAQTVARRQWPMGSVSPHGVGCSPLSIVLRAEKAARLSVLARNRRRCVRVSGYSMPAVKQAADHQPAEPAKNQDRHIRLGNDGRGQAEKNAKEQADRPARVR